MSNFCNSTQNWGLWTPRRALGLLFSRTYPFLGPQILTGSKLCVPKMCIWARRNLWTHKPKTREKSNLGKRLGAQSPSYCFELPKMCMNLGPRMCLTRFEGYLRHVLRIEVENKVWSIRQVATTFFTLRLTAFKIYRFLKNVPTAFRLVISLQRKIDKIQTYLLTLLLFIF